MCAGHGSRAHVFLVPFFRPSVVLVSGVDMVPLLIHVVGVGVGLFWSIYVRSLAIHVCIPSMPRAWFNCAVETDVRAYVRYLIDYVYIPLPAPETATFEISISVSGPR